jgi:hypothetical protein
MSIREPRPIVLRVMPLLLALWTLFVWVGRIRNLAQEPGPILEASRWSLVGSVLFTVLGAALLGAVVVDRVRATGAPVRLLVLPLAGLTTVVWVARGIDIAIGDHSASFIAVHLVLAVVSIGLAAAALQGAPAGPGIARSAGAAGAGSERDRPTVGYPPTDG